MGIRKTGLVCALLCCAAGEASDLDWPVYLGGKDRSHYSTLDQINQSNVGQLEVAWTFDTGDRGEFQANPLVVRGVLYTVSPKRKVIALDAATGKEIWRWDPASVFNGRIAARQRGVVYWEDGEDRRIFTGVGTYLYALDADTGKLIESFGKGGSIHLGEGVEVHDRPGPPSVVINTPGVIYESLYIVGGNTTGPGTIRAYDVRSGEMEWIFYTIPRPGEYGVITLGSRIRTRPPAGRRIGRGCRSTRSGASSMRRPRPPGPIFGEATATGRISLRIR